MLEMTVFAQRSSLLHLLISTAIKKLSSCNSRYKTKLKHNERAQFTNSNIQQLDPAVSLQMRI